MTAPMRICLVSAEVVPFAKTGGLADVTAAVSRFLGHDHDVRVIMPLYRRIREGDWPLEPHPILRDMQIELGQRSFAVSVQTTPLPDSDVPVLLIDCPELFDRKELYGGEDEHLRFALLSRAAIHVCQWLQWSPDIVHCNDWHTGLVPLYLKAGYGWDKLFEDTKTLLTIHNIGYQGTFPAEIIPELSLEDHRALLYQEDLDAGFVNLLKTGLLYADALSTACFILGPEACLEMLAEVPGEPEAVIIGPDLKVWMTPGTEEKIVWRVERDERGRLPGDPAYR